MKSVWVVIAFLTLSVAVQAQGLEGTGGAINNGNTSNEMTGPRIHLPTPSLPAFFDATVVSGEGRYTESEYMSWENACSLGLESKPEEKKETLGELAREYRAQRKAQKETKPKETGVQNGKSD
jgi:hypothetical protein